MRPSSLFEKTCKGRKIGKWVFGHCMKKLSPMFLFWIRTDTLPILQKRKPTSPLGFSSWQPCQTSHNHLNLQFQGSNIPPLWPQHWRTPITPAPTNTHTQLKLIKVNLLKCQRTAICVLHCTAGYDKLTARETEDVKGVTGQRPFKDMILYVDNSRNPQKHIMTCKKKFSDVTYLYKKKLYFLTFLFYF